MYEQAILISADDVSRLRSCDVFRVLDDRPNGCSLGGLACWIVSKRPDLLAEVNDCLAEVHYRPSEAGSTGEGAGK